MLNWETVDPNAVYPRCRYRAASGEREYKLTPQTDSAGNATRWWHLLMLDGRAYRDSLNCRSLISAKRTAEGWEAHEAVA
jgi:hypothetical protein